MKLVIQRVLNASVEIESKTVASIGKGIMVLIGIATDDTKADVEYLSAKLVSMRIFSDENGLMNLSVKDVEGALLLVSQFTLLANARKGNRPSYIDAARPEQAIPLYELFCDKVALLSQCDVQRGVFGADMKVHLTNDGPVTIVIDSKERYLN